MMLIPAIDIKGGRCVRLRQGKMDEETVFGEDPVVISDQWVEAGARRLHLVDLDGALSGEPVNADVIQFAGKPLTSSSYATTNSNGFIS